ncbi:MAG TPA: hypothetical protein VL995_13850 [Cellvibrio sp.]|nr:hypothetical protein [Cellvibrio sp.]
MEKRLIKLVLMSLFLSCQLSYAQSTSGSCSNGTVSNADGFGTPTTTTSCTTNQSSGSGSNNMLPQYSGGPSAADQAARDAANKLNSFCGEKRYVIQKEKNICDGTAGGQADLYRDRCKSLSDTNWTIGGGIERIVMFSVEYSYDRNNYTSCLGDVDFRLNKQYKKCENDKELSKAANSAKCAASGAWTGF